jgi:hypothetical protein
VLLISMEMLGESTQRCLGRVVEDYHMYPVGVFHLELLRYGVGDGDAKGAYLSMFGYPSFGVSLGSVRCRPSQPRRKFLALSFFGTV